MAKSNQINSVRSDPGTEVSPLKGAIVTGKEFVVGKYDEFGRKKSDGAIAGGQIEGSRIKKLILDSMQTRGGNIMPGFVMTSNGPVREANLHTAQGLQPVQPARTKTAAAKQTGRPKKSDFNLPAITDPPSIIVPIESTYKPAEAPKLTFPVVFAIESGTIRSSTDAILENDIAIILVYHNQDAISYTPQQGSMLDLLLPDNRKINVMYLGMQFQWYDSNQQLLVFMKNHTEN